MILKPNFLCLYSILILVVSVFSCKPKDEVVTKSENASLRFSVDTVQFDTLFSTVGSVTKRLKVYNDAEKAVEISSISLGKGAGSSYSVIIGGVEDTKVQDQLLRGKDSLLVLVKVYIDPMDKDLPFLVKDSLMFETNGNQQNVKLISYGQDANFIAGDYALGCNETWSDLKPYVILDSIHVSNGCKFTIEKGVRVYFNENAKLSVDGVLEVKGSGDSVVVFAPDNNLTSEIYVDYAYWEGIKMSDQSGPHLISWAEIINARSGVTYTSESLADSIFDIEIDHLKVINMFENGLSFRGVDAKVSNSLMFGAINYNYSAVGGGNHVLSFCTLDNEGASDLNSDPSLLISNNDGEEELASGVTKAYIENSIIWGNEREELDVANAEMVWIKSSLLKTRDEKLSVDGNILNESPRFKSVFDYNFELDSLSPAIDSGFVSEFSSESDLNYNNRDLIPDMGAFEYQK